MNLIICYFVIICGSNHFNMQMKIIVDTEEKYNTWLAEQATIAETIKNK